MKSVLAFVVFSLTAISLGVAQSATAPATQAAAEGMAANSPTQIHGAFPVILDKNLDSKKAKVGDPVVCKMAFGLRSRTGIVIPAGTKVIGHVTQAEARSKGGSQSSLGIAFDKIEPPSGQAIPIKGVLQAVGPSIVDHSGPDTGAGGGNVGMGAGGGTGGAGTTAGPQSWDAGNPNGGASAKMLNAHSQGIVGIKGLELGNDSVITSSEKEIKLESGTQFLVRSENEEATH